LLALIIGEQAAPIQFWFPIPHIKALNTALHHTGCGPDYIALFAATQNRFHPLFFRFAPTWNGLAWELGKFREN